jgi:hypothetical protein
MTSIGPSAENWDPVSVGSSTNAPGTPNVWVTGISPTTPAPRIVAPAVATHRSMGLDIARTKTAIASEYDTPVPHLNPIGYSDQGSGRTTRAQTA